MSRFEKWGVWITSLLTVATGVGYFVTKYLFTSSDPYSVVGHPWQPYFLKAHILVSPLLLFALGAIAVDHVWSHYVRGVQLSRRTAVLTAVAVLPMVLTGYLIQVLTAEGWVTAMAWSHIGFGVLYGVGLGIHSWIVRRELGRRRESVGGSGATDPGSEAERGAGRDVGTPGRDTSSGDSEGASPAPRSPNGGPGATGSASPVPPRSRTGTAAPRRRGRNAR